MVSRIFNQRADNPFVPIHELGSFTNSYYLVPDTPVKVYIPAGAITMMLSSTNVFYLGIGPLNVPTAGTPIVEQNGIMISPNNIVFYCLDNNSVNISAPNDGTIVSVNFTFPPSKE